MATYAELLCSFVSEVKLNHEDDIVDQVIKIRRFKFYKSIKCIYLYNILYYTKESET